MDPNAEKTQVYFSPNPWFKRKLFWVIFALVMISIPVGAWIYGKYFMKSSSPPAQTTGKTLNESQSPIAFDILKNPMVYEWRGSVEGVVTAKDDHSITISDNQNHKLTIPVIPSTDAIYGTKFYKRETKNKIDQFIYISHKDISLGSKVRGDFFVAAREKDKIIGSSFEIIEQ